MIDIEAIRAAYRRDLEEYEAVTFRQYDGSTPDRSHTDFETAARVMSYSPADLVGNIKQGDSRLIVLAEDFETAPFAALRQNDKAIVRGRELNIEAVDDSTRRVGGVLIAYEIRVRG